MMFNYDELVWTIFFPAFCFLLMWCSIILALLVRAGSGRRRREAVQKLAKKMKQRGTDVSASLHREGKAVLRRAVVVVGGDFARSPRMQYHAASLMKCGMFDGVVLVGFNMGNKLIEELQMASERETDDKCLVETKYLIPPITPPEWFICFFPHKKLRWLVSIFYTTCVYAVIFAWFIMRASFITVNEDGQLVLADLFLVQSPPAVPFVLVIKYIVRPCVFLANLVQYYGFILPASWIMWDDLKDIREGLKLQNQANTCIGNCNTFSRFVLCPILMVDWHNFGYTIMQCEHRPFFLVWLYWVLECYFCFGNCNVTVSAAMRNALLKLNKNEKRKEVKKGRQTKTNDVVVLYDNPPLFFGPVSRSCFVQEVLCPAMRKIGEGSEVMGLSPPPAWVLQALGHNGTDSGLGSSGLFMVASTSWTLDDDYSMVVEALLRIDKRLQKQQREGQSNAEIKPIWLLVTGKGISRGRFERAVTEAKFSSLVTVTTMYFQLYVHYAMALGAADVGLCIHHSSSGLDLPMKAVDMLGSGLPVVALQSPTIGELLDDKRGWLFNNSEELEKIFWRFLTQRSEPGSDTGSLEEKRRYVREHPGEKWNEKWNSVLLPLLRDLL